MAINACITLQQIAIKYHKDELRRNNPHTYGITSKFSIVRNNSSSAI